MSNATKLNSERAEAAVVRYTIAERVATITIDRPEVLNDNQGPMYFLAN